MEDEECCDCKDGECNGGIKTIPNSIGQPALGPRMRPSRIDVRGTELGSTRRLRRAGFLSSPGSRVPLSSTRFSDLALGNGNFGATVSFGDWSVLEGEGEEEYGEEGSVPVGLSVYLPSICCASHRSASGASA